MRYSRLSLEPLEGRLVPFGTILATLSSSGVLTITGDDDSNVVSLLVTGGNVTLTPDVDTTIKTLNGESIGLPVPLVGEVKSIKADLKGGGDDFSIDTAASFDLTGSVAIALGDGNNLLNLKTTGLLKMASLTVTGGDGSDEVTVQGGVSTAATNAVVGAGRFTYSNGGGKTTLDTVKFGSVTVSTGNGGNNANDVSLNNVNVTKTVSTALANSKTASVEITNSTIGGLKGTGYAVSTTLIDSTVAGVISIKGGFQADLQMTDATINKSLTITAPFASMTASGVGSTINSNLTITGNAYTETFFQSSTLTNVIGNLSVKGAWFTDVFDANSNFKVHKNLSLKLGDGDNEVTIGDGGAAVEILGNLSIQTGAGNDLINLDRLALTGTATLKLFGGADELSIENNAALVGAFSADMGAGDDLLTIAQNTGTPPGPLPGPVVFSGKVKILAGSGNDTLLLGLDPVGSGGDETSLATFLDSTSTIDGGLGLNEFDFGASQFSGAIVNW